MRRTQIGLFIILVFVSAMFGGGFTTWLLQGQPLLAASNTSRKLVTAEEFRLIDAEGKTKAVLTTMDGYPGLVLFDGENMRLMLEVAGPTSAVRLFDSNGDETCTFNVSGADETCTVSVSGKTKGESVGFGIIKHIPYLRLDKEGSGGCFIRSESDMLRFSLYSKDDEKQTQGKMMMGVDKDGGALILGDEKARIGLYLKENNGFISIYQDGKIRWKTPSP